MKDVSEVRCCVVDYMFTSIAEKLAETFEDVAYYSPFEQEYLEVQRVVIGDGLDNVRRIEDPLDPNFFDSVDLFIFPDRGFAGLQRDIRRRGKAVWGSFGACELEEYRTRFLKVLEGLDMPIIHSEKIKGLTALGEHLKGVENKWVKIDRFRNNMETFHHQDFQHTERILEGLAVAFGPVKDRVKFVVQDDIKSDLEIGYDGWSVLGEFPERSFQGYEKKNELYVGSALKYSDLPEEVRYVNEKFSPVLASYGYANFWATEIRIKDGIPYFIDPTARMPGQTGEHLLETCRNLAEVIWAGANGTVVQPDFTEDYAAEATLHYTAGQPEDWKTFVMSDEAKRWVKLYHYCYVDGAYHFPPHNNDELGIIMGNGESVEEAIENLQDNMELIKDEPVCIRMEGFADILSQIEKSKEHGMKFTDKPLPDPAIVLESE